MTANQIPTLFLQLPAGVYVDRWNRKTIMIVCDAGHALALAVIPLTFALGILRVPTIAVVALAEGCFTVFYRLAEAGAVRNIVPAPQYPSAVARNQARTFGAAMLGRPAAGFLFSVSRALPFGIDALSYLCSLLATSITRGQFQLERRADEHRHVFREARDGLSWIWGRPYFRALSLMVPAATLLLQVLPLVVIVLVTERHTSPGLIGFVLLGFSIGGLAGSLGATWLRRHLSLRAVTVGGPWLWAATCACIALAPVAPSSSPPRPWSAS